VLGIDGKELIKQAVDILGESELILANEIWE